MVAPSPCLYTGQVTRSRSVDAAARLHTPLHGPPQETGNIGVKHPSGYWVGFHFHFMRVEVFIFVLISPGVKSRRVKYIFYHAALIFDEYEVSE
jgi:hypothetical protein